LPLAFGEHREELAAGLEEDATETWELSGEPRDCFFEDFFNSAPQLFSLRDSSNKLHVKIANSVWSRGIGLQNASHTTAYLQMPEKRKDGDREAGRLYELSVVEYSAKNDFWRTKVVAFAPRFVLLNKMSKTLFCKQNSTMDVFTLLPNERVPFHWTNNNISEKKMQIRLDQGDCTWSTGFALVDFGFFPVQMLDEETCEPYILQVKFQIENGIVYVVFTQDAKNEVYMIQNQIDVDILVTQKDSGIKPIKLTAGKSQPWGWFDPDGTRQVEIKLPNYPHRISHHIDKIKDHTKTHKYKDHEGKWKRAYVRIKAVNGTRILQVRIYRKKAQMRKDKLKEEEKETNKFIVNFKGVGLSMINEKPEELLYFTMEGIRVELLTFPSKSSIEVNIKDCQIDNQIVTTYHPVLLYSPSETPPQFFKFTFIKNTRHSHLTYIEYLSVLMREVNICVDEELVLKMLSFVDVLIEGMQEKSPTEIEEVKPLESSITETSYGEMIYTELFHLNPIKLNFTFTAIKGDDEENKQNKNNIARIILKIPDKLIPNVDNAPLNLNALLMSHSFITKQELTARLAEHYRTKFMRQLYKILGSFDALGNPVSFVKNMGAGVHDLFYEPAKGMTVSAKEFGKGLGRGAASLVKKSVYAIFNSASKITGSISKGVAILSMDNEYQQKRQVEKFRQRPRNAIEGIGYGLKDLGTGIIKGLYGIVEQPVKGGMAEGAKGVFKGIGRGFVGVVIKPTVGGIDFVQRTMEGVKNTTTLDEKVATRKRPPRYLNSSTKLRVYSAYEAQGQDMLHSLGSSGEYWDHIYWYHEEFDRKRVLLVSDKAIFIIKKKKIEWRHSFANLIGVERGPEPNQLTLTVSKKSLLESSPDKTVNCQSEDQANKVYKTLMDLWEKFKHIQEQNAMSIENNTNKK
jgi:vacuolar protein sorting-associated protein 13A/C